jgi:hypothetical protein
MPQQTITAAIKYHNSVVIDAATMAMLLDEFNKANEYKVPRAGQSFQIPILPHLE